MGGNVVAGITVKCGQSASDNFERRRSGRGCLRHRSLMKLAHVKKICRRRACIHEDIIIFTVCWFSVLGRNTRLVRS
jgi:hypothetical protein